jgi:ABC-type proline/glycine betaine transport system substrate-binding protein
MRRISTAALAVVALLVSAGCGSNGGSTPVEGSTTPTGTTTVPATTGATTTATTATTANGLPPKIDAVTQMSILQTCLGGKASETFRWFQPTVDYAKKLGGDGFTVTLDGKLLTLIVFPYVQAAQYGYKDIQDRLIALQQKRPTDYATVSATAAQAVGNVLEVATQGALSAGATQTVTACISKSST